MPPILSFLISVVLTSIGPVAALIVVLVRSRGRARTLGTTGMVLVLVGVVSTAVTSFFLPLLVQRFGMAIDSIGLLFVPSRVVSVVALILLGLAVGASRGTTRPRPGPSGPWSGGPVAGPNSGGPNSGGPNSGGRSW